MQKTKDTKQPTLEYVEVNLEGLAGWYSGKEIVDVVVTLGQNDKGSSCEVTVADPDNTIAEALINHSLTSGGILPIEKPAEVVTPSAANSSTDNSNAVLTAIGTNPTLASGWELAIVQGCIANGVSDPNQIAYILATAQVETTMGANLVEPQNQAIINNYQNRAGLGNTVPGDGIKYRGRGLVQLTGKANYVKMSKVIGVDIVKNPDLLLQAKYAVAVLVLGMKRGDFTGRKLGDYISGSKVDFVNARRIVNGTDKAQQVANDAANVKLPKVKAYIAKSNTSAVGLSPKVKPVAPTESKAVQGTSVASSGTTPNTLVKGNKLTVSVGSQTFEFFHQGTETSDGMLTKVIGKGVRWVLNRRTRNKTEKNLKLSELAAKIATAHKVKLSYQATIDPLYDHVDQTGLTDYQLLKRECERSGLFLSEVNNVLTIKSLDKVEDTKYVAVLGYNIISYTVKDAAIDTYADDDSSSTAQAETKTELNPVTGQFEQKRLDIDPVADVAATGKDKTKPTGTLAPGQDAVAAATKSRTKRVKGLPSTFVLPLDEETLALTPMMAFRTKGLPGVLSRIWFIDSVKHSVAAATTTIDCYSPVEVVQTETSRPEPSGSNSASSSGSPTTTPKESSQGYIWGTTGIFTDGAGEAGNPNVGRRNRRHRGYDIAAPIGRPIVASKKGVVTVVANEPGGAGLWVQVNHEDGFNTKYFHMSQQNVKAGQKVVQGQVIGLVGNTGGSRGAHLHQEFWNSTGWLMCEKVGLSYKRGVTV